MSTVFQQSLPLSHSQTQDKDGGIRRRLSLNLKIQPSTISSSPAAAYWAFRRSKWWGWGWDWILSRKPTFATDLEMNEEETAAIGTHNKGSWRHVFYKLASHLRRKLLGSDNVGLPQTYPANNNYCHAAR